MGIFILLATGSLQSAKFTSEYLGDGIFKTKVSDSDVIIDITTGRIDDKGKWHGPITIVSNYEDEQLPLKSKEEVNMVHGKRHGKSKYTDTDKSGNVTIKYSCYNMGHKIECEDSERKSAAEVSSFQILSNKYPWFLYAFNAFGFEDEYIEAYMDTLETLIGTYEFEDKEFYNYYDDVLSDLSETVYDSIISIYSLYSSFLGRETLKNDELRLAVVDAYRSEGESTYDVISITYSGYLHIFNDAGITDQDFEKFCQDLDSVISSYGPLDMGDPFFLDSLDTRLFGALSFIMDTEEVVSYAAQSKKGASAISGSNELRRLWNDASTEFKLFSINSSSAEVAELAIALMIIRFYEADIVKQSVREPYLIGQGVLSVPTVTTEFSGNNSATSLTLGGYIIEDGGAVVTSSGIAWADYYNPTTDDQTEASGKVSGAFTVTIDGLTEDAAYYARSYATNSEGTAYGNCISFTANSTVSIVEDEVIDQDFAVYPNPSSAITTFIFTLELSEDLALTIVNMKGQVAFNYLIGSLPLGENQVKLDLSGLQDGLYSCQLRANNGTIKATRKLLIAR